MNDELIKGEVVELMCISKGSKGDGVFKHESGRVVFAEKTKVGKIYRLEITRVVNKCAFAIVVKEINDNYDDGDEEND